MELMEVRRRVMSAMASGNSDVSFSDILLKAAREEGFTISEFLNDGGNGTDGYYMTIPHSLGQVPSVVIAFRSDIEPDNSGYQIGCTTAGNYGADNSHNRNYRVETTADWDLASNLPTAPFRITQTVWNFCRSATGVTVELRNGTSGVAKMLGDKWYLAVK